jgi:2-(1,2-epoxy-1,2-dihydrophenyl)acetyl-CoA isomerase
MTPDSEFELAADLDVLRVYRTGAAAKIELHRPERMNAWNGTFGIALRSTVADLGADPAVRAVLVTGAGRGFSSGADLRDRPAPGEAGHSDTYTPLTELYHPSSRASGGCPSRS